MRGILFLVVIPLIGANVDAERFILPSILRAGLSPPGRPCLGAAGNPHSSWRPILNGLRRALVLAMDSRRRREAQSALEAVANEGRGGGRRGFLIRELPHQSAARPRANKLELTTDHCRHHKIYFVQCKADQSASLASYIPGIAYYSNNTVILVFSARVVCTLSGTFASFTSTKLEHYKYLP